jgi:hypothetical protein
MTNAICAICQLEFDECKESHHINCDCKETFSCCNNSFHKSCVSKLFESKIITTIMRIAKCPLCRNYVDRDTKLSLNINDYVIELEESIIDYDLQILAYKKQTEEYDKKNKKLVDLCDNIIDNNHNKIDNLMELHRHDIENIKEINDRLSLSLKKSIDNTKILFEENKKNKCEIEILEFEKNALKKLIYQKNDEANSIIRNVNNTKINTIKINKESQTEDNYESEDNINRGVVC